MICEDLKGKKALVTGSSSGIGAATAVLFSEQGCFVGVHYFHTEGGAKETLEQVKNNSDGILLRADVRDEKQAENMVEKFAKAAGGIDILVNNAGSLIDRQPFETATLDYHEDVYATNVRSIFLVTRAALPYLKKSKGNIVNIGSVAGHTGGAGGSGMYSGAKAAVATETMSWQRSLPNMAFGSTAFCPVLSRHASTSGSAQPRTGKKSPRKRRSAGTAPLRTSQRRHFSWQARRQALSPASI